MDPHSGPGSCVKTASYGTKLSNVRSSQSTQAKWCCATGVLLVYRDTIIEVIHARYIIYVTNNIWYASLVVCHSIYE